MSKDKKSSKKPKTKGLIPEGFTGRQGKKFFVVHSSLSPAGHPPIVFLSPLPAVMTPLKKNKKKKPKD